MLVIFSLRWHFTFLISILRYIFCTHIVVEISVNPATLFHIENQNISNCPAFFIQAPSDLVRRGIVLIPKFREYHTKNSRPIWFSSWNRPGLSVEWYLLRKFISNFPEPLQGSFIYHFPRLESSWIAGWMHGMHLWSSFAWMLLSLFCCKWK